MAAEPRASWQARKLEGWQRAENRGQRTEGREQRAENRGQGAGMSNRSLRGYDWTIRTTDKCGVRSAEQTEVQCTRSNVQTTAPSRAGTFVQAYTCAQLSSLRTS